MLFSIELELYHGMSTLGIRKMGVNRISTVLCVQCREMLRHCSDTSMNFLLLNFCIELPSEYS
jgi:hypothetical protein